MKFDKKYINTRITGIVVIAALVMIAIIGQAVVTGYGTEREVEEGGCGECERHDAAEA